VSARPIRIANCSGFFGDRLTAAREMVEGGPIDVLTGDWLAELTMLILARRRAGRPGVGYADTVVDQLEAVLATCLERNIKIVVNAGGLDPQGCAHAIKRLATTVGVCPSIAFITGDDLSPRLAELAAGERLHPVGQGYSSPENVISANAYLGGWGIAEALQRGADIVVTGRVTDAALVTGPAAWHHGWRRDDWDALAGGVVAGHLIECGTQVTGGNYAFFEEVPGLERIGFPWADVHADGSCVIGKHDGTGGAVSVGTVTSQLLYEIAGPAYLGPDVTTRFDTVTLRQCAPDRVEVSGATGEPPPPTYKVSLTEWGGYRQDVAVAVTGLDVDAKVAVLERAFWTACRHAPSDYTGVTTRVDRTGSRDPQTNAEAVSTWRLTLKDADGAKLGPAVSDAVLEMALATIPGMFMPGETVTRPARFGVFRPALVDATEVRQRVQLLGGESFVAEEVDPALRRPPPARSDDPPEPPPAPGPLTRAPLGRLAGARSGDKGADANVGVFVRSDAAWRWLDAFLTVERLRALLPEVAGLPVARHRLPRLRALNFVISGLLEDGVGACARLDPQAKGLGEWLRAREVDIPRALLDGERVRCR
jgi:hypothetical protein